jgi:hypothetical protein
MTALVIVIAVALEALKIKNQLKLAKIRGASKGGHCYTEGERTVATRPWTGRIA